MFNRRKDKEVDYTSLNKILSIGSKLAEIFYIISIIAIVLLCTYVAKEWKILKFIGEFLTVISPIFIGLIVAWLFDPFVKYMESKKIPRILGCIITYILIIGGLFLLLYLIIPTFFDQVKDFASTIPTLISDVKDFIDKTFNIVSAKTTFDTVGIKKEVYKAIEDLSVALTTSLPTTVFNAGKNFISGGINFVLGLMIGFYMLYDYHKLDNIVLKALPSKWHKGYKELGKRLNTSLRKYIQGIFIVMFIVFLTQSIGLTIAGLKAPLIFALFCAITDIIPYFGPYIGAVPAILVGFSISPLVGIGTIISILVVQALENNFYQPLIMGHTMKLHPVTIMLGLLIFGHFFGILGMIISTPAIAAIKIIFTFTDEKLNFKKFFKKEETE